MWSKKVTSVVLFTVIFFIACHHSSKQADSKAAVFLSGYQLVDSWPQLPPGYLLGNPTGIGIDSSQHVFIFHRAGRDWPLLGAMPDTPISASTILMLDKDSGKIINSFGDSLFIMPHGLTVDGSDNIWVTDVGLHQVFKFTHEGKLLMKLGEAKVAGKDSSHFDKPTDVAVAKDGSFYVSDGYGNSRIIHFSAGGKYLFEWGKRGGREGEFNVPHAIDLDADGNVYVADRENKRIQVFTATGKFVKQLTGKHFGRICSVCFNKPEKQLTAVDDAVSWWGLQHNGSDILVFDSTGDLKAKFGKDAFKKQDIKCWYHDVVADGEGCIYVTDILGNRIQKFRSKVSATNNK